MGKYRSTGEIQQEEKLGAPCFISHRLLLQHVESFWGR